MSHTKSARFYESVMFNFFHHIYCLNVPHRTDRWTLALQEFERVGIKPEKFSAVQAIGPHQSFTQSQKAMMERFFESGKGNCLILEDDVVFKDIGSLGNALSELPENWEILYLGANIREEWPVRYSGHLFHLKNAWTSHAIAYTRGAVEKILAEFPNDNYMYDNWLGDNLHKFNAFITCPLMAVQRPGRSDIWGHDVDYGYVWKEAEQKLI